MRVADLIIVRRMLPMRSCLIFVAVLCGFVTSMSELIAGQDESVIVEGTRAGAFPAVTIVAVDGRRLKAGQQQISTSPGRHRILVRITDLRQSPYELPFEDMLEANHRYVIQATLWGNALKTHVDKRPR
jgi:hypothetical protein